MLVKDLISKIQNGSSWLTLVNDETGEIYFKGIWSNKIESDILEKEIISIEVSNYSLKIFIK